MNVEAGLEKKTGYESRGGKRVFWRGGKAKETANSEGLRGVSRGVKQGLGRW